jgi:tRNA uridine 5-carbamoylmethylation protein Kti12
MIIFMAGYPFSGKSHVLREILNKLPTGRTVVVVDPKRCRTDHYGLMSEEEKREENLAAWEVSLDLLIEQIKNAALADIVVYDTACASLRSMKPYFEAAKKYDHKILYVFVRADLKACERRAGENWVPQDVLDKYVTKFEESVPTLAKMADARFIIENSQEVAPNVSKVIEKVLAIE